MLKKVRFMLAVCMLLMAVGVNAQVTTASMSGKVTDASNETIIGATVQAVHEPSGTRYGTITNTDGRFFIQGMRTGGPYKVEITYVGYQTVIYEDVTLQLGEVYNLNVSMAESSEVLSEVVVTATKSKFSAEKTGASTNISSSQMTALPTINRSISDIARLSPYANGMSFAGGDGRSTNFTIDGANFNNNFGLSSALPGGGNPVSMDAIEEVQVVVAPFDVRQTNFIGGGINAVTKSGTNTFKGSAYTYHYNDQMRGNRVDGTSINVPDEADKHVYGATFGGPIIKNKLFFFANVEYTKIPSTITTWRASDDGIGSASNYISAATNADLKRVSDFVKQKYGYDTGSWSNYPADESNLKILGRVDWNITDKHRLALRYNYTTNTAWNATNGNSNDAGFRDKNKNRLSQYSMAYANACYSQDNNVSSISADLNSRLSDALSNQLLFTYTNIADVRGSNSSLFPFVDIFAGYSVSDAGVVTQNTDPYISLGYELFTYNNEVHNKIYTLTDNFTANLGAHKLTAGFSYEHQMANNAYMRNGTGYYRYRSVDDFINGEAPESFALCYGYNGNTKPAAEVAFNQFGLYLQDDWNISKKFKLNYGIRFDYLKYNDDDIMTNNEILRYDFGGRSVDTGKWPDAKVQVSPRVGFVWDVLGDKRLKVRGGTGFFAGRLPLVFFTNMPTNSGMIQNLFKTVTTTYNSDGTIKSRDPRLDLLKGGMVTDVNKMIELFNLPTTISPEEGQFTGGSIAGVDTDFKMPQVWKSSIGIDYQLPVSFPLTVTGEFMYTKNIQAVMMDNWNIKTNEANKWERFSGADNRLIYPSVEEYTYYGVAKEGYQKVTDACVLTNTSKGYGYTANITVNAEPVQGLNIMASYTHTESKEVTGMPGNNAYSTWQGVYSIDGPNFAKVQRSQYVIPDRVIASLNYTKSHKRPGFDTHYSLFYTGYSPAGYSYLYSNDMNGDGVTGDLIYIPKNDSEINFVNTVDNQGNVLYTAEQNRADFWAYANQDSYLKNHKGQYAEAYSARAPWVHQFDLRIAQDFSFKVGKSAHKLQLTFDFMNIGNMFNSKWGVAQNMSGSNNGQLLTYMGRDENNVPTFTLYRGTAQDSNKKTIPGNNTPTKTFTYNKSYSQCWQLQVGIRYIFN